MASLVTSEHSQCIQQSTQVSTASNPRRLEVMHFCQGAFVAFPRLGYFNCHWLVTLTRADLVEYAGAFSREKLSQLEDALRLADLESHRVTALHL